MKKQEFNYVVGYSDNYNGTVISIDGTTRLVIDHSRPVNLARFQEILLAANKLSGQTFDKISICLSVFEQKPEGAEGTCECFIDKRWDYDKKSNSLVIYDNGYPVYANDNGAICRDSDAICDSVL